MRRSPLLLALAVLACAAPVPPSATDVELRVSGRAVIAWLRTEPGDAWWIEERLAPIPMREGDRDPGVRAIVRAGEGGRVLVWEPGPDDRLIDAVVRPDGTWAATVVDDQRRPVLARGDRQGLRARALVEDPALAEERGTWAPEPPANGLRLGVLSAPSLRLVADGDELVIALMNDTHAVLAYRVRWRDDDTLEQVARTLVSPAAPVTPYLPIGGSYDSFDAMWVQFHVLATGDGHGGTYVACWAGHARLRQHNLRFGTDHALLQSSESLGDRPTDVLVVRVDRDGAHAWSRVVGTVDRDDEPYAIAASSDRVAIVGRSRRERGLDNTELHVMIARLDADGAVRPTITWDADASAIAQAAAWDDAGALWVGGAEGWRQNPEGFSLFEEGHPFLVRVDDAGGVVREDARLAPTEGHAELRALAIEPRRVWIAGLERAPLTHTGDADPSRIRADGWWRVTPR